MLESRRRWSVGPERWTSRSRRKARRGQRGSVWVEALVLLALVVTVAAMGVHGFGGRLAQSFACLGERIHALSEQGTSRESTLTHAALGAPLGACGRATTSPGEDADTTEEWAFASETTSARMPSPAARMTAPRAPAAKPGVGQPARRPNPRAAPSTGDKRSGFRPPGYAGPNTPPKVTLPTPKPSWWARAGGAAKAFGKAARVVIPKLLGRIPGPGFLFDNDPLNGPHVRGIELRGEEEERLARDMDARGASTREIWDALNELRRQHPLVGPDADPSATPPIPTPDEGPAEAPPPGPPAPQTQPEPGAPGKQPTPPPPAQPPPPCLGAPCDVNAPARTPGGEPSDPHPTEAPTVLRGPNGPVRSEPSEARDLRSRLEGDEPRGDGTSPHAEPNTGGSGDEPGESPEEGSPSDGNDDEPLPNTGGDPNAPPRNGQDLNDYGLTKEQQAYFRKRIDGAESAGDEAAARQARYDRNVTVRANTGKDPMPPKEWVPLAEGISDNSLRGRQRQEQALAALGVSNNDRKLDKNGNERAPDERGDWTSSDGTVTRPDAVTDRAVVDVKSTLDSEHPDGGPRTVNREGKQIQAQRELADETGKEHVTIIVNGAPDNVRPSGPLAQPDDGGSDRVLHYNPDSGEWSVWGRDEKNRNGGWKKIDASKAKQVVGEDLDPEEARRIFGRN